MFKNAKKKFVLVALTALALGNSLSASAATAAVSKAEYSAYVKKTEDYTTSELCKSTLGNATNQVSSIDEGAQLCSWVNNHIGRQATSKANYEKTGTYAMVYETGSDIDIDKPGAHLLTSMTISTRWFEFGSANTSGIWSPDSF